MSVATGNLNSEKGRGAAGGGGLLGKMTICFGNFPNLGR